jgi:hypothetical protein
VFFIAAAGRGDELTGVKVERADDKSAVQIARHVAGRCAAIGEGTDPEFGRGKRMLAWTPPRLLRHGPRAAAWRPG